MVDPTYQFFTNEDFKKILSTQGDIQTDVAVANTNLKWIVENYKNQCDEFKKLQTTCDNLTDKYNDLRADMGKYIGIGIGLAAAISLLISLLNLRVLLGA